MKLGGFFSSWVGGLVGALALAIIALIAWVVIAPPSPDEAEPATIAAMPDEPAEDAETDTETDTATIPDAAPETEDLAEADAAPEPVADPDVGAEPGALAAIAPGFDVVRIRPDGSALVAGRAEPGALVSVLVDGEAVAEADSDAGANFVAMFSLPPLAIDRVMTLEARLADGTVVRSESSVIVEGVEAPPDVVALAEPPAAETPAPVPAPAAPAPATPDPATTELAAPEPAQSTADAPAAPVPEIAETVTPETEADEPVEPDTAEAESEPAETAAPVAAAPEADAEDAEAGDTEEPVAAVPATDAPVAPAPETEASDTAAPETDAPVVVEQPEAPPAPTEMATPEAPGADAVGDAPDSGAPPASPPATPAPAAPAPADEPPAPRILLAGPDGMKILQDPGPSPQLSLDAIGYDEAGDVALAGRGRGADTLQIYLDNTPVGTARVEAGGQWRAPLPDIAAGIYTLRVDSIAPDGTVTSRVETPFQREDPEVLAAAGAQAAASAAAGEPISAVTVQPGHTLWAIARGRYGQGMQYWTIFDANRDQIRDPDWIYPGQVFALPETSD